jgi:curved DNA-binding protein CbpA
METQRRQTEPRQTSAPPTYYTLLGLPREATSEQVERAYRQRIRQIHPDQFLLTDPVRHAAAQDQLKEVLAAIQLLRDPGARRRYDALLEGRPLGARLRRPA